MRVVVSQFEGVDTTPVLPLAAGVLVASLRADAELGAACDLGVELVRRPIADAVTAYRGADVLGFSLYPWNARYALAVAAAARAAHPEGYVVVGGPSVPRRPDEARRFLAAHPYLDALVFSEGEVAFRELVRARRRGADARHVAGLALRDGDAVHVTAPPERVLDLAASASPFLDGTFDALWEVHRHRFAMALLETNRGCPFSCTFCDWSLTKKVVEFPLARVEAELAWVVEHGLSHVMLADANFGIRPRDLGIAHTIAAHRKRSGRPASFYFYLTKNDHARNLATIDVLHAAGIGTWVGLAVQDFDDDVLAAVERDNIQTGEAQALRAICGARGIPTFNELILGLPGQTYASLATTLAEATPPWPRHDFVLFLCRLIDNAELGSPASRARHALDTRHCRWPSSTGVAAFIDEASEVVVGTRDLPVAEWQRAYRLVFLTAALYNLRLLRVVMHAAVEVGGLPRRALLLALADALAHAPAGSVYAALNATLDRYLASILAEGPLVLSLPGARDDAAPVPVDDALAAVVLPRYDWFLAESMAALAAAGLAVDAPAMIEAVAYQRLITPRWQASEPQRHPFAHDWPAYLAAGTTGAGPSAAATVITFTPPSYVDVDDAAAFVTTHLSVIRTRLDVGVVSAEAPRSSTRTPRLNVLSVSG